MVITPVTEDEVADVAKDTLGVETVVTAAVAEVPAVGVTVATAGVPPGTTVLLGPSPCSRSSNISILTLTVMASGALSDSKIHMYSEVLFTG